MPTSCGGTGGWSSVCNGGPVDIAIGCRFRFDVARPTHAVVLVEPHIDEERRVRDARFSIEPGVPMTTYGDLFGNRCRRLTLPAGHVELSFAATVDATGAPEDSAAGVHELDPAELPDDALVFLLPSRYCQSDQVAAFAFEQFGHVRPGWGRVQAIMQWVHDRIGFDYGAASPTNTAVDVLRDGHGVCRDFAHLAISLCRALNIPARYVFGYLPDIGVPDSGTPMDFCAWTEVHLGGRWYTFDPRNNQRRIGRTIIGRGRDAADVAMVTTFGTVELTSMTVIAEEVARR
jgi:transglutaminase-like putative cysteine protease